MQRERIGLGAVVVLGRHHLHIGHLLQGVVKRHNAICTVAIVVGDQYFHGRFLDSNCRSLPRQANGLFALYIQAIE